MLFKRQCQHPEELKTVEFLDYILHWIINRLNPSPDCKKTLPCLQIPQLSKTSKRHTVKVCHEQHNAQEPICRIAKFQILFCTDYKPNKHIKEQPRQSRTCFMPTPDIAGQFMSALNLRAHNVSAKKADPKKRLNSTSEQEQAYREIP